jgi:hypothetical protein
LTRFKNKDFKDVIKVGATPKKENLSKGL